MPENPAMQLVTQILGAGDWCWSPVRTPAAAVGQLKPAEAKPQRLLCKVVQPKFQSRALSDRANITTQRWWSTYASMQQQEAAEAEQDPASSLSQRFWGGILKILG